ncbi:MAG: pilus assembly protein TadG-related protein [Candidatus Sulfotelmatobacter sp.]
MLPPLIERPRPGALNRRRERGVTLALVAVAIFSIVAMAALSIDIGTLYQASAEAQRAADAAALAAARSISISGLTGDPLNSSGTWATTCTNATQTAQAVAQQNSVGGASVPAASISVTYSAGSGAVSPGSADCSTLGAGFAVNPVVTVKVSQSSLPTYFSRIWGRTGSSVSATASAEAFNPSNSDTYAGQVVPVQPRCVKPLMLPNFEPWASSGCTNNCTNFVDPTSGAIKSPGILADSPTSAVIGQTFWLLPDCRHNGASCSGNMRSNPPQANYTNGSDQYIPPTPNLNLEYLPGQASYSSTAVPSGSDACSAVSDNYAQAIAGCDQTTVYQCGVQASGNYVDLSENPGLADTTNGAQCLIHQGTTNSDNLAALGQDTLQPQWATPPVYPFQIQAGTSNPLTPVRGDPVTSSTSIVSLPIYDSTQTINTTGTTNVTIIGFLQVFINYVDGNGNLNVTVMNVAGCGNQATGTALAGSSPVPVRLITPP